MLELRNISKQYTTGTLVQRALDNVSLSFRKSEFVAVLGPSGSGKTTLLNIIGGLDRYDSGDLIINSISTKKYNDRNWDAYRNHTIGFVFQNYNLIPHQSVLSNVELALTISGVSRSERRARAKEALKAVGLGDQIHKRPNQMSGGQMQRVAIARALVNDPDVLLADEPTGALDSETSVQVMNLLREVAKDRLVIMVTHNGELADEYASRIVRLRDGRVIDDSDPYDPSEEANQTIEKNDSKTIRKTSMSFLTAISLSLNNLRTKKGRTILTAFAGSIGIIGIAMILALSTGIHNYVNDIQEQTLSSYPVVVERNPNNILKSFAEARGKDEKAEEHRDNMVYSNPRIYRMFNAAFTGGNEENNLKPFKAYITDRLEKETELSDCVKAIHYDYGLKLNVFFEDTEGNYKNTDLSQAIFGSSGEEDGVSGMSMFNMVSSRMPNMNLWSELIPGRNGEVIDPMIMDQYVLLAGAWPKEAGEIVLILSQDQEITDNAFYALGLIEETDIQSMLKAVIRGEPIEEVNRSASFDSIIGRSFKLILPSDYYRKAEDGSGRWENIGSDEASMNLIIRSGFDLRVVGIIKPGSDNALSMSGAFGYTSLLSDYIIDKTEKSELVRLQSLPENENFDLVSGLPFVLDEDDIPSENEKAITVREYFSSLSEVQKVDIYTKILGIPDETELSTILEKYLGMYSSRDEMVAFAAQSFGFDVQAMNDYLADYTDDELRELMREQIIGVVTTNQEEAAKLQVFGMIREYSDPDDVLGVSGYHVVAAVFDQMIEAETDTKKLALYYDEFMPSTVSGSTLKERLEELGCVDKDTPNSISIYVSSFDDKEKVTKLVTDYNEKASEEDRIDYTDYVALLMSGITTIIDAVSYGLIAFVTISLVVSSIMIGIITYISVLERTKEIGILRSIGASKHNIRSVFNAETLIIGFIAGLIGIGITLLLCIPLNLILHKLTGIQTINAVLPFRAAVILVAISMFLTLIAGLIPSGIAARKDPVAALRTE